MKKINFRIVFASGEAREGELIIYRSDHPLPSTKAGFYLGAPGSDEEYARVPVRIVDNKSVSDFVTLETTCAREMLSSDYPEAAPRAVYSCVYVQGKEVCYQFFGFRVPESLSEETTFAALEAANMRPEDRWISIEAAERLNPLSQS